MRGRILSALVSAVFICCASVGAQEVPEPKRPVLPTGFSEIEILRLAIDNYDIKSKQWTERGATAGGHCEICGARVVVLDTLNVKHFFDRKYFVALINGQYGDCTQCSFTAIVLVDTERRMVDWRAQPEGHDASDLKILSGFAGVEGPFIQFDIEIGVPEHRNHILRRLTYHLTARELGIVTVDLFWSGLMDFEDGGAWGGIVHRGSGSIRSLPSREFEYEQRTFYGSSSNENPEIRWTERWSAGGYRAVPVRMSVKAARVRGSPGDPFPFGLPVRNRQWHLRQQTESRNREMIRDGPISPDGRWRVKGTGEGLEVINMENGSLVRSIKFEKGRFNEFPEALGWETDSFRFFAVFRLGIGEGRALLSFSVRGRDDYWEKLLTDDPTDWRDGFILEPVGTASKK